MRAVVFIRIEIVVRKPRGAQWNKLAKVIYWDGEWALVNGGGVCVCARGQFAAANVEWSATIYENKQTDSERMSEEWVQANSNIPKMFPGVVSDGLHFFLSLSLPPSIWCHSGGSIIINELLFRLRLGLSLSHYRLLSTAIIHMIVAVVRAGFCRWNIY